MFSTKKQHAGNVEQFESVKLWEGKHYAGYVIDIEVLSSREQHAGHVEQFEGVKLQEAACWLFSIV